MGNLWFELTGEYYKSVKKLESTGYEQYDRDIGPEEGVLEEEGSR